VGRFLLAAERPWFAAACERHVKKGFAEGVPVVRALVGNIRIQRLDPIAVPEAYMPPLQRGE
jgi:hypothetical protein